MPSSPLQPSDGFLSTLLCASALLPHSPSLSALRLTVSYTEGCHPAIWEKDKKYSSKFLAINTLFPNSPTSLSQMRPVPPQDRGPWMLFQKVAAHPATFPIAPDPEVSCVSSPLIRLVLDWASTSP